MKKMKKGFTLTELIATIAILAIIVTIAGIGIVKIRDNTLKGQKENVISSIKVEAKKYYKETGIAQVPVGILISTGRLEGDQKDSNGDPILIDPVTKESMNCGYVDFSESESGEYYEDGGCSDEIIAKNSITIYYKYNGSEQKTYGEAERKKWFAMANGEKLTLISCNEETCPGTYSWTTPNAPDLVHTERIYDVEIPSKGYIDEDYRLEVVAPDGQSTSTTFRLKADAIKVGISDVFVSDYDEWKQSKTIHAKFVDNESGLYGYAFIKDGGKNPCKSASYTKFESNITEKELNETITENGTYTICAKDNAGNITEYSEKLIVKKIDRVTATISVSTKNSGTTYYKSNIANITLTEKGPDNSNISGINSTSVKVKYVWSKNDVTSCSKIPDANVVTLTSSDGGYTFTGSVTISGETGSGKVYICPAETITDRAGNSINKTNISAKTNLYLDNTAPSGSISIARRSGKDYNSVAAQFTISGLSDSHSGIDKICVTEGAKSTCGFGNYAASNGTHEYSFTSSDEGSGKNKVLNLYIVDKAGNEYSTSGTYTLYTYCTDTARSGESSWKTCSKKCGTGTQYRDIYYVDKHISSHTCPTVTDGEKQNCNTMECCSKVYFDGEDKKDCSVDCGGGKLRKLAYSSYDDSRCKNQDEYSGSKCNTQACCSEGTYKYDFCDCNGKKVESRYNECLGETQYRETSTSCSNQWFDCGGYGICSTTCGTGSQSGTCKCYDKNHNRQSEPDSITCTDDSGCVDPTVNCGLYAKYNGGSSISCYFNSNQSCAVQTCWSGGSKSGTYTCKYSGIGSTGNDTCGAEAVNGYKASNWIKVSSGVGYYRCKNNTDWCKI